jgi:hypothetical protein
VVSAIGIVLVPFYLLGWYRNVLPVFSAFCVESSVNVLDVSRVAVRLIATAKGRIVGHVPRRIEFFVQGLILWRMVALNPAMSSLLRQDRHCQQATETGP